MLIPRLVALLILAAFAAAPGSSSTGDGAILPDTGYCYEVSAGSLGIDQNARVCPPVA